jgi:hypothetical protein
MKYASIPKAFILRVVCLLCLPLFFVLTLHAQSTLGSIFGTVTDSSGAVVPDAVIIVTSVEQGTSYTAITSSDGTYRVAQLQPGTYRVSAEHEGFAKARSEAIPVAIQAIVRADLALKTGSANVTVDVTAANALLETGSAEVSSQITAEELHDLPSNDRNIVGLMSIGVGVTGGNYDPSNPSAGGRVGTITGGEVVAMGTPPVGNSFLLDGVATNMEFSGTIAARPPMDMAAGFQTQIAQFPADEGRASGAILNMSLKSGTNKFHGSVYGYAQNNYVNAQPKNYFTTNTTLPYHRYEYGANLGGPIIRNKLFFFAGYEGLKQYQSSQTNYTVPAMSEKTLYKDFAAHGIIPTNAPAGGCDGYYFGATTDSQGAKFGGITVYDPTSVPWGSTATRKPYANNCVPASAVSPTAQALLKLYPDPNYGPTQSKVFVQKVPRNLTADWEVGKVNWTLSPRDALDLHLLRQNQNLLSTGLNQAITETTLAQNGINSGINYFRTISPRMVNVIRLSYTRFYLVQVTTNQQNFLSAGIPGWPNDYGAVGPPTIGPASISGIAPVQLVSAFSAPFRLKENNYQLQDMLSWQHGKHSFKFGGEYEQIRFWEGRGRSGGGNLSFAGTGSSLNSSTTASDGIPDMLLGLASSVTTHYMFSPHGVGLRTHYIMPYVQDDWRVLNNLTLNIGLRYNIFTPYHAEHDMTWNFDPATGTVLIPNTSTYASDSFGFTTGLPAHWAYVPRDQVYRKVYWKSFDPRIGFAYQANSKLVWRGGFGLYHIPVMGNTPMNGTTDGNDVVPNISTGAPDCLDNSHNGWCGQVGLPADPSGGVKAALTGPGFAPFFLPRNLPDPYSIKFSTDFQFSPTRNMVVAVGYLGANTEHFAEIYQQNQAPLASTAIPLASRVPYSYLGQFASYGQADHTNYNGGTISVEFRNWHGLQFKSYYTYSKSLGLSTGNDQVPNNSYNFDYDYGPLDYDIRHRDVTTFIYRMPTLKSPKIVGAILGQWDLSGVINLQSGMPFTVTDSGGTAINVGGVGTGGQRPYLLHNPNLPKDKRSINGWFDTTAFAHTYWCTGAKVNSDIVTATAYAIGDAGNPCQGITAIPNPTTLTNNPSANHIVSSTAQTMPVPWGNEGKNALQGPAQKVFTTAIQRRFNVEFGTITLRLEEYNLFNHPNYRNPGGVNLNATSFGLITGSQTFQRQLHGSLRFDF